MTFQIHKPGRLRFFHKLRVQFLVPCYKGNIHQGAILFLHRPFEQPAFIQKIIENLCLSFIIFLHCLKTALPFEPLKYLATDVDAISRRRIIERLRIRMSLIFQHGRRTLQHIFRNQILTDNYNHNSRRSDVLLDPAVNHTVFGNVDRL